MLALLFNSHVAVEELMLSLQYFLGVHKHFNVLLHFIDLFLFLEYGLFTCLFLFFECLFILLNQMDFEQVVFFKVSQVLQELELIEVNLKVVIFVRLNNIV